MLLERRASPRYVVDSHAPITLDSVVKGTIVNASEAGLAIETPYKPVLNSVVRISAELPDNESPCEMHAQVIRSSSSGQIGLKILKPESFRRHFETWRRFSTNARNTAYMAAQPQADTVVEAIAEPSVALEELRAAILEDEEASDLPIFSRTGIFAGVIAVAVFAGAMWLWSGRTHKSEANVQASGSPSAEAPAEIPSPLNLPQNTSKLASHPSAADASTLPSTLDVARRDDTTRPAVVRKPPESQRASRAQIVVGLNRFTRVNPKLLHNPDRIYFDLSPGTSPKLSKSSIGRATGSTLVRRIRIGHADDGHTRVVLDLERPCKYQAKVSRTPPYKLIINIRRAERGRRTS